MTTNKLADMDSEYADAGVISNIKQLAADNQAQAKRLAYFEQKNAKEEQSQQRESLLECQKKEVLTSCDEEFGAEFRDEACNLALNLVKTGKKKQPANQYEGAILMQDCYKQVKAEAKEKVKVEKNKVSGSGKTTRKPGTMQEVLADMKKDKSWMND